MILNKIHNQNPWLKYPSSTLKKRLSFLNINHIKSKKNDYIYNKIYNTKRILSISEKLLRNDDLFIWNDIDKTRKLTKWKFILIETLNDILSIAYNIINEIVFVYINWSLSLQNKIKFNIDFLIYDKDLIWSLDEDYNKH